MNKFKAGNLVRIKTHAPFICRLPERKTQILKLYNKLGIIMHIVDKGINLKIYDRRQHMYIMIDGLTIQAHTGQLEIVETQ